MVTAAGSRVVIRGLLLARQEANVLLNVSASRHYAPSVYALTNTFDVLAGVPRKLNILRQPDMCSGGSVCSVQPVLQLLDGSGNILAKPLISLFAIAKSLDTIIAVRPMPSNSWTAISNSSGIVVFTDILIAVSGRYEMIFFGQSILNMSSQAVQVVVGNLAQALMIVPPTELVTS